MLLGALAITATIFLIWLLCTLAVHALPLWTGGAAAWLAYETGAGLLGAALVGVVIAGLTLGFGELAFARLRSPIARTLLAATFAIPAAIAGYHAARGIASWAVPSETWRTVFACVAAVIAGAVALARLASAPHVAGQVAAGSSSSAGLGISSPTSALPPQGSEQLGRWARPTARPRLTR